MRLNRRAVALGALALAAGRSAGGSVGPRESSMFRLVNRRPESWHGPIWVVMQAGSLGAAWAASAAVWTRHDRREATRLALVGTAVWAGVKLVKPLVGRGRPAAVLDDVRVRGQPQTGLGFPSGHAAVAMTLALLVPSPDPRQRCAAVGGAVIVGLARMYVGAHLPLDVVGGLAIGTAAARQGEWCPEGETARPGPTPRRATGESERKTPAATTRRANLLRGSGTR